MEPRLAPFIAIEGMDGSGKTTLIKELRKSLLTIPDPIKFTREPGGTPASEAIRSILLDDTLSGKADGKTQLLGFFYARAHHLTQIRFLRGKGITVLTDRFDGSTLAYQAYAQTIDQNERKELHDLFWMLRRKVVYGDNAPTLYLYLDLPPEVAYSRRNADSLQVKNHYDTKPLAFYRRQHDGYGEFFSEIERIGESKACHINAEESPDNVYRAAARIIREHLMSFSS